jgi:hypothetical protein
MQKDLAVNPFLTGLTLPAALSATGTLARTVETVVSPFANVLEAALGQFPEEEGSLEITNAGFGNSELHDFEATQNSHRTLMRQLRFGQPQKPGETGIDFADVRRQADVLRDDLQQRLQQVLTAVGITEGLEVRLRLNPDDASVEVIGNHPQRVAIEGLFASDPQLSQDFRNLTAIGQLLHAAETTREFAEAYEKNPWQAVAQFPELFGSSPEVSLLSSPAENEIRLELDVRESQAGKS